MRARSPARVSLVAGRVEKRRGGLGGFGLNAPGAGPKVTHFAGGGGGGKKILDVPEAVAAAWNKVLDDDQPETFVLATYAANGKGLELKCAGTEGLAAFKAELADDQVMWGGFKCLGVDNRGSVVCKRPKFVFVQYMPAGASVMKKAKMGTHKGAVKEALHSAHLDLTVESKDEDLVERPLHQAPGRDGRPQAQRLRVREGRLRRLRLLRPRHRQGLQEHVKRAPARAPHPTGRDMALRIAASGGFPSY